MVRASQLEANIHNQLYICTKDHDLVEILKLYVESKSRGRQYTSATAAKSYNRTQTFSSVESIGICGLSYPRMDTLLKRQDALSYILFLPQLTEEEQGHPRSQQ